MGRGLALALAGLGGCDWAFGLDTVMPRDGGADVADSLTDGAAASFRCLPTVPAYLCADFEQGSLQFYDGNLLVAAPVPSQNVTVELTQPGPMSPTALSIDSKGDNYTLAKSGGATASTITATFAIDFSRFDTTTADTALATLGYDGTTLTSCYCYVAYQASTHHLLLQHHCDGAAGQATQLAAGPPAGFPTITLSCDLRMHLASAKIAGMPQAITLQLSSIPRMGTPYARIGIELGPARGAAAIRLDDVRVTTGP